MAAAELAGDHEIYTQLLLFAFIMISITPITYLRDLTFLSNTNIKHFHRAFGRFRMVEAVASVQI